MRAILRAASRASRPYAAPRPPLAPSRPQGAADRGPLPPDFRPERRFRRGRPGAHRL